MMMMMMIIIVVLLVSSFDYYDVCNVLLQSLMNHWWYPLVRLSPLLTLIIFHLHHDRMDVAY